MSGLRLAGFGAALAFLAGLSFAAPASAESIAKQCGNEWKAAKAAGTTNGESWSDFYKACKAQKSGAAAPAPTITPVAAPTPVMPSPTPTPMTTPASATPTKLSPKKTSVVATGAGEFASETEARAHCPTDTIVWVNTKSHKYHYSGNRRYGTTKQGSYMCEADAKAAGDQPSKGEKPK